VDFKGRLKVAGAGGAGIPAVLRLDDIYLELWSEGEELGVWRLDVVEISRNNGNRFALDLDGEEMEFEAADPLGFAYEGLTFVNEVSGKLRKKRRGLRKGEDSKPLRGARVPGVEQPEAPAQTKKPTLEPAPKPIGARLDQARAGGRYEPLPPAEPARQVPVPAPEPARSGIGAFLAPVDESPAASQPTPAPLSAPPVPERPLRQEIPVDRLPTPDPMPVEPVAPPMVIIEEVGAYSWAADVVVEQVATDPAPVAEVPEPAAVAPRPEPVVEPEPVVVVEPEPEPVALLPEPEPVEVLPEPEPVVVRAPEPVVLEPVAVLPEPEPVVLEPVAVLPEPEPVVLEPVAVLPEPEPVVLEPVAVLPEPEPVVLEPVAVLPEPEPVVVVEPAPEPEPEPVVMRAPEPLVVLPEPDQVVVVAPVVEPEPVSAPEPVFGQDEMVVFDREPIQKGRLRRGSKATRKASSNGSPHAFTPDPGPAPVEIAGSPTDLDLTPVVDADGGSETAAEFRERGRHATSGKGRASRRRKPDDHNHEYDIARTVGGLTRRICVHCGHVSFDSEDVYQGWG
jgi:hypothetical protein